MDDFSSRGKTDWISQGALDDGAVHKRKRSNKPDRQGEDGQAILKAHRSRLVYDKAPGKAFHRAAPSPTTKPQLIGFS